MTDGVKLKTVTLTPECGGYRYEVKEADNETSRASQSFGTRKLDAQEKSRHDLEAIRVARNEGAVVRVRVGRNEKIRQGLLPIRTRPSLGRNSWVNKYKAGRFLHRILAWIQGAARTDPNQSGSCFHVSGSQLFAKTLRDIHAPKTPINDGFGNVDMPPRSVDAAQAAQKTVEASDRDLVKGLGYESGGRFQYRAYAVPEHRVSRSDHRGDGIFGGRAPQLSDIRQSDKRQTCHFLSNLAAILAQPDGAERIQNMMVDNGDGTVTVRFRDKDVRVTKDRIVDSRGSDIFNLGAPWVRIMEKAFLGYQMSNAANSVDIGPGAADFWSGKKSSWEAFDHNSPSVSYLPLVHAFKDDPAQISELDGDGNAAPPPGYSDVTFKMEPNKNGQTDDTIFEAVKETLEKRGSAHCGWSGPLRKMPKQLLGRIVPGHSYTILAVSERQRSRKGDRLPEPEKGYLLFYTYNPKEAGLRPGDVPPDSPGKGATIEDHATKGEDTVFFVSFDQASKLFNEYSVTGPHVGVLNARKDKDEANPPVQPSDAETESSDISDDYALL